MCCGFGGLVGSIDACKQGKQREAAERAAAEEEARKIEIQKVTRFHCQIDGCDQESAPPEETTIRVLPESAEGTAGKIETASDTGYCEEHSTEKVKLAHRIETACPFCPAEVESDTRSEWLPRGDLPDAATTEDHKRYALVENLEDVAVCSSRTCTCLAESGGDKGCKGSWSSRSEIDPMTDKTSVWISTRALFPYVDWLGRSHTPVLYVRCKNDKTEVIIDNDGPADPELGRYNQATVSLRFDEAKAKRYRANESTDSESLFLPSSISLAKRMLKSDSLLYEFTPFQTGPATLAFDLRGLDQHIEPLRETCGW